MLRPWFRPAALVLILAALIAGCAENPPAPVYGPFTPRNGAGAPIDRNGIPIIGTPWRS